MENLSIQIKQILSCANEHIFVKQIDGRSWTLSDISRDVENLLFKLHDLGLAPYRKVVGLAMRSSYEWIVADFASLISGAISLPVPLDFSDEQIISLLDKADYCLIQNEQVGERLKRILPDQCLILPKGTIFYQGKSQKSLKDVNNIGSNIIKIIHTSGTTSTPKGVMIRDEAVALLVYNLLTQVGKSKPLHYLSFVPMSLLIEQVLGIYMPLLSGGSITLLPNEVEEFGCQSEKAETYINLIKRALPNFLYLPPKLLESGLKLIGMSSIGEIFGKNIPHIITGGARVNHEILKQFDKIGVPIYEAYGLSENSSVISINSPVARKIGTVGKILPSIVCKIEEGELIIKSPTLCAGYFTTDSSSCDISVDGYLRTGDLAHFDEEGFLCITGRKKHLIILSNARNVSPEWVESIFKESPHIDDIIVFGDGMDFLAAVVLPINSTNQSNIMDEIARLNKKMPDFAQLESTFLIEDTDTFKKKYFTITGRPKRKEILNEYIQYLYTS